MKHPFKQTARWADVILPKLVRYELFKAKQIQELIQGCSGQDVCANSSEATVLLNPVSETDIPGWYKRSFRIDLGTIRNETKKTFRAKHKTYGTQGNLQDQKQNIRNERKPSGPNTEHSERKKTLRTEYWTFGTQGNLQEQTRNPRKQYGDMNQIKANEQSQGTNLK